MTTQSKSLRLADQLANNPYCWPGGYPLFAITSDGAALCKCCAKTEREAIATTTGTDGWCITAIDANWEDPSLFCDHCNARIESAYAEPPDPALVLMDSNGIYIPQLWCSHLDEAEALKLNLNWWDVQQCQAGPDGEHYWFAWTQILDQASWTDANDVTWHLHQDGDLWEVAEHYQWPEQ
jgi:hypothetical protein